MEESIADVLFLALIMISIPVYTGIRQWMVRRQSELSPFPKQGTKTE